MNAVPRTVSGGRVGFVAAAFALLGGCAAAKQAPGAAEAPSQSGYGYGEAAHPPPGAPAQAGQPPPPPPAPAPGEMPATPSTARPAQPGGGAAGGATNRSMAIHAASNDVESSQRELDAAGGDCRNACRALGSMDRAAGHLCELSQGSDEGHRCDDAKKRVYSARERVRTTCGSCPNGPSVERAAPIPSLR